MESIIDKRATKLAEEFKQIMDEEHEVKNKLTNKIDANFFEIEQLKQDKMDLEKQLKILQTCLHCNVKGRVNAGAVSAAASTVFSEE